MKVFGREIPLWTALTASLIMAAGLLLHLSSGLQTGLNAVVLAVAGIFVAVKVHDGVSAAVLGGVKALFALLLDFGLHVAPDTQVAVLTVIAAVFAFMVRSVATAPVDGNGNPVKVIDGVVVPPPAR